MLGAQGVRPEVIHCFAPLAKQEHFFYSLEYLAQPILFPVISSGKVNIPQRKRQSSANEVLASLENRVVR